MRGFIVSLLLLLMAACASQGKLPESEVGGSLSSAIRVIGKGKTFEDAKLNAFSNAIEISLGSIVIADAELSKNKFIRDDIAKHSGGYVENYKVIDQIEMGSSVTLIMDVRVISSKIQERVLSQKSDSKKIEGDKLSDTYQTYIKDRSSGDKLLNMILSEYPKKAFNLKKGATSFNLDEYRNAIFIIEYELRWSYNYLSALNEALSILGDKCSVNLKQERFNVISKNPNAWILGNTDRYCFNDIYRGKRIKRAHMASITVWGEIKNDEGKSIFSGCSEPIWMVANNDLTDPMIIFGNETVTNDILIKIPYDHPINISLSKATKVELSYSNGGCYNYN